MEGAKQFNTQGESLLFCCPIEGCALLRESRRMQKLKFTTEPVRKSWDYPCVGQRIEENARELREQLFQAAEQPVPPPCCWTCLT